MRRARLGFNRQVGGGLVKGGLVEGGVRKGLGEMRTGFSSR